MLDDIPISTKRSQSHQFDELIEHFSRRKKHKNVTAEVTVQVPPPVPEITQKETLRPPSVPEVEKEDTLLYSPSEEEPKLGVYISVLICKNGCECKCIQCE